MGGAFSGSPWLGLLQTVGVFRVHGVQTVLPGEGCLRMMPHLPAWGPDGAGTLVLGHMPGCGGQDGQPRPHRELCASALGGGCGFRHQAGREEPCDVGQVRPALGSCWDSVFSLGAVEAPDVY